MAYIKYYLGSMYAGKSSSAVDLLLAGVYDQKFIVTPTSKVRGFVSRIHASNTLPKNIQILEKAADLPANIFEGPWRTLVFIDEVQFIDDQHFWHLLARAKNAAYVDIILAGLNYDQYGHNFDNHAQLENLFTNTQIHRLYVPCATCSSAHGEISIRKWKSNDRILDEYAVLCKTCFDSFFYKKPADPNFCGICQSAVAKQRLRKWKHDAAIIDEYATICTHCYHSIHNYGDNETKCNINYLIHRA
ncbi:hypothetical protein PVA44_07105 (plasmid) [Entomospira nematocerorum]|uniref:thymidine kinase n=1 Tax=Entomospira nematocerorum TaxID=2719987 RepID=A0A968GD74_9SPIO|nr:hypothetical protein [Entomospira nematocera]NIZ47675.1 hypothetical protein [Entomospira nematocera]WDI34567.1 hypothetical protein PVA44_07105 [Entomospira nematocera]